MNFPKFVDGRGYSTASLLRQRYGYSGELRAVGDVLHDQLFYMKRVGFDAYALKDGKNAALRHRAAALRPSATPTRLRPTSRNPTSAAAPEVTAMTPSLLNITPELRRQRRRQGRSRQRPARRHRRATSRRPALPTALAPKTWC